MPITAVGAGINGNLMVDGHVVIAVVVESLRGAPLVTTVAGRLPRSQGELALGATTMRQLGLHLGSQALVATAGNGALPRSVFRVVGEVVFPPSSQTGGLGTGALIPLADVLARRCPSRP